MRQRPTSPRKRESLSDDPAPQVRAMLREGWTVYEGSLSSHVRSVRCRVDRRTKVAWLHMESKELGRKRWFIPRTKSSATLMGTTLPIGLSDSPLPVTFNRDRRAPCKSAPTAREGVGGGCDSAPPRISHAAAKAEVSHAQQINEEVAQAEAERGGLPVRREEAALSGALAKVEYGWVHHRAYHSLLVQAGCGRSSENWKP